MKNKINEPQELIKLNQCMCGVALNESLKVKVIWCSVYIIADYLGTYLLMHKFLQGSTKCCCKIFFHI